MTALPSATGEELELLLILLLLGGNETKDKPGTFFL